MKIEKKSAIAFLAAVVSSGGVLGASAESLRRFALGSVAVGGEIGRRMDVTLEELEGTAPVRIAKEKTTRSSMTCGRMP